MRKRISLLVVFLVLIVLSLSANQKYYYHDSPEYIMTKLISNVSASVGPSIVTPVSGDSLIKTLKQINRNRIPSNVIPLYDELLSKLETPKNIIPQSDFGANLAIPLDFEMYGNTNPRHEDDYIYGNSIYEQKDRKPIFSIRAEGWWSDYVYGKFSFDVKKTIRGGTLSKVFTTNIPKGTWGTMELVSPFDTGISFGTDFLNVFIGRGKLNVGNGKTGNMFISDNFKFQDFAKFSLDSKYFDYDFTYTHFDQQTGHLSFEPWMTFNGKNQIRLSHHYTANIFNRVAITFHEGTLMQSDSALDIRMFNPFIFMHNWQGFYNSALWANNFVALEINANLGLGLTSNIQIIADQVQLGSEVAYEGDETLHPNALGFLGNLSHTAALKTGFLETFIEGAYTMPSLYLNNLSNYAKPSDETNPEWYRYNYDLILGYYTSGIDYFDENGQVTSSYFGDISYSGYKFGPDTIALALGTRYVSYSGKLDASFQSLFKMHGEKGIKWHDNQDDLGDLGHENVSRFSLTGTIEYMLELKASASYAITDYFKISSVAGYRYYWNYQNNQNLNHDTFQYSIGFAFDPSAFIPDQN